MNQNSSESLLQSADGKLTIGMHLGFLLSFYWNYFVSHTTNDIHIIRIFCLEEKTFNVHQYTGYYHHQYFHFVLASLRRLSIIC